MKAAVMERMGEPLNIGGAPDPALGSTEVLIRVRACGICRTDLHILDGWMKAWFGLDPFPLIPGHEVAGEVAEVGSEVTAYKPGDRVVAFYLYTCGQCRYCLSGQEQTCQTLFTGFTASGFNIDGGYAEYMVLPERNVTPLPDGLDFETAAPLVCGGLTAYGALKNARVRPSTRVAVLGIGGIGHVAIQIADAMGAEVTAITGAEDKAELARKLGADDVIVGRDDVGAQLRARGGADVVVSTTVDPKTLGQMIQGVLPRGSLVIIGLTPPGEPAISIEPGAVLFGQQRITGNLMGSRWDLRELLELAQRNNISPMSEIYPLEDVNEAHERVRNVDVRFRAVLVP
ncbi:MAG: alcohol dehydrogenase catalytic domain-containing protein [Actinomycetota bacterium]|nr:alcohol dehydrogenase catalytic domain-containing protein [Actinomycetota bacterium]